MKYHLTGFGVSALLHAGVLLVVLPLLLWQNKLDKPAEEPSVVLSLAQFVPAPPPEPVTPVQPEPPPVLPEPKPQPVEKPKPKKKPVEKPKPKPEKKPIEKPKPKPEKKPVDKPKLKPEAKPELKPQPLPQTASRPPVTRAPAPVQPVAPTVSRQVAPVPKPVPQAAPAKPVQPAANPAAEAAYRRKLQSLIASRKKYPRQAMQAEAEGSVVVALTVLPNGAITNVRVTKSSGNNWLDKAAVQAVNAASGALPFPPEIRKTQWPFSLTVNFKLDW